MQPYSPPWEPQSLLVEGGGLEHHEVPAQSCHSLKSTPQALHLGKDLRDCTTCVLLPPNLTPSGCLHRIPDMD